MNHLNLILCAEHHRLVGEHLAELAVELRRAGLHPQAIHTGDLAATHQRWAIELRHCADALAAASKLLQPAAA